MAKWLKNREKRWEKKGNFEEKEAKEKGIKRILLYCIDWGESIHLWLDFLPDALLFSWILTCHAHTISLPYLESITILNKSSFDLCMRMYLLVEK